MSGQPRPSWVSMPYIKFIWPDGIMLTSACTALFWNKGRK